MFPVVTMVTPTTVAGSPCSHVWDDNDRQTCWQVEYLPASIDLITGDHSFKHLLAGEEIQHHVLSVCLGLQVQFWAGRGPPRSALPDVTNEQMEMFLKYHNTTPRQRGRVNGNVGRMSCKGLRSRPLWLWLQWKKKTRSSLFQKSLEMHEYIQRDHRMLRHSSEYG